MSSGTGTITFSYTPSSPPPLPPPPPSGNSTPSCSSGTGSLPNLFLPKRRWGRAFQKSKAAGSNVRAEGSDGEATTVASHASNVAKVVADNIVDKEASKENEASAANYANTVKSALTMNKIMAKTATTLLTSATSHLSSMFSTLKGTLPKAIKAKYRSRPNTLASTHRSFKPLSIGSAFPNIPMLNLRNQEYTTLVDLTKSRQLVVLEFYVSATRKEEPIIAVDP